MDNRHRERERILSSDSVQLSILFVSRGLSFSHCTIPFNENERSGWRTTSTMVWCDVVDCADFIMWKLHLLLIVPSTSIFESSSPSPLDSTVSIYYTISLRQDISSRSSPWYPFECLVSSLCAARAESGGEKRGRNGSRRRGQGWWRLLEGKDTHNIRWGCTSCTICNLLRHTRRAQKLVCIFHFTESLTGRDERVLWEN